MSVDAIIVVLVILSVIFLLYKDVLRPAVVFLIAMVVFSVSRILKPQEILSGFANEQIAVIILLLILGRIISKTSVMDYIFKKLFSSVRSYIGFLFRMMFGVAGSSAFINNTPIVAMLTPYVYEWGKKNNISVSKLLVPLSYASILGGCATLIGTSTNLIVNGLAVESGLPALNIFDFSYVGVPLIFIGILYILTIGVKLLPEKRRITDDFIEKKRKYIIETVVSKDSKLIGNTVEEGKLRNLRGLFLVEIIRGNKKIAPVEPAEKIKSGDHLIFAGATDTIVDLINLNIGLSLPETAVFQEKGKIDVVESVVSHNSSLIGKKVKNANFRANHDAAILAIHRNNEKLSGKIGEITLHHGDVLLLLSGKEFQKKTGEIDDIYIVSNVKEIHNIDKKKIWFLIAGTILAIMLPAFNIMNITLFQTLLALISLIIILNIVSVSEIRKYIDLDLLAILGFALAIGKALNKTGIAEMVSNYLVSICSPLGTTVVLAAIFIITNILGAFITNKAAVAITFPIAITTAISLSLPLTPFILVVAYGGAASFITPIGYQTNLMVYGPGGYTFKDFFKIGLPLTVIYMLVCITILSYIYKLY